MKKAIVLEQKNPSVFAASPILSNGVFIFVLYIFICNHVKRKESTEANIFLINALKPISLNPSLGDDRFHHGS